MLASIQPAKLESRKVYQSGREDFEEGLSAHKMNSRRRQKTVLSNVDW
jgi:hypothetical protein